MDLGLQADSAHAQGFANTVLIIDDEFLRDDVDDFSIHRNGDGFRCINDALHIALAHFLVFDGHNAMAVEGAHVSTGNAGVHGCDFAIGHQFRFFHRVLDGVDRRVDVHHNAFA